MDFRNQPWLGFEVVGVYHDRNRVAFLTTGRGNLQQLVEDAKAGKIHNVYITNTNVRRRAEMKN